jgi:hypothetical protein
VLAAARPEGVDRRRRAAWARWVRGPEHSLWATVAAPPVVAPLLLTVPRRPPAARAAPVARRFCPGTRCPPRHCQRAGWPAVTRWAVQVPEGEPPTDGPPMAWLWWTTVAVETVAAAIERVQWYSCRWGRAVWHRSVQSGWRMAERPWASGERWQRCWTLSRVMAGRMLYATMLARAVPDRPCSVLLDLAEWPALSCASHPCSTPPEEPPSLEQAVRWMAQLGGFVGRRRRDHPGTETLWRGFQH